MATPRKPAPELTPEQQVVRILIARTGWGRLQAKAFFDEMTPEERKAVLAGGLVPEHAAAAEKLFGEISDAVRKRRKAPSAKARPEPTDPPAKK